MTQPLVGDIVRIKASNQMGHVYAVEDSEKIWITLLDTRERRLIMNGYVDIVGSQTREESGNTPVLRFEDLSREKKKEFITKVVGALYKNPTLYAELLLELL